MAEDLAPLRSGRRGTTYLIEINGEYKLLKQRKESSAAPGTIRKEYVFNKACNKIDVGPKVYSHTERGVLREYVQGWGLWVWTRFAKHHTPHKIREVYVDILDKTRLLDRAGIRKPELTRPLKDILVTAKYKAVFIDFERCSYADSPGNVNQFVQFVFSEKLRCLLGREDVERQRKQLLPALRKYKEEKDEEAYQEIREAVSSWLSLSSSRV